MRRYGLPVVCLLAALGCVRLGLWQVSRLKQRRAHNAELRARLSQVPIDLDGPLPDSLTWRHATARGIFDYQHQILLTDRTQSGLPGVYVVTPYRLASGRVVLVERGWLYAPDGINPGHIDEDRADSILSGIIVEAPAPVLGSANWPKDTVWPKARRYLDVGYMTFNYAPITAVLRRDSALALAPMQGVAPPALDDGPHLSYAIQWFSFALIALVGGWVWMRKRQSSD